MIQNDQIDTPFMTLTAQKHTLLGTHIHIYTMKVPPSPTPPQARP